MPSPFPGMDPYLEDPRRWRDVHHRLISAASDRLTERLRPHYLVRIEERVYLSDDADPGRKAIEPDLRVFRAREGSSPWSPGTGAAVMEPIAITTVLDEEVREARLEIRDATTRRVVTVIEVLSPANKISNAKGRRNYSAKRREVMESGAHLVEIDLLRRGRRYYADPILPPHEYSVHLSKAGERPRAFVWPIRLSERLPTVAVPVLPEHPDAPLDLQSLVDSAYDRGGYDYDLDYSQLPVPPLKGEWAEWADRLLIEKGLRAEAPPMPG